MASLAGSVSTILSTATAINKDTRQCDMFKMVDEKECAKHRNSYAIKHLNKLIKILMAYFL